MSYLRLGNYNVPGHLLRVTMDMAIKTDDASGDTSGTDRVSLGVKPKSLGCALRIRFADDADLRELMRVAEAKDGGELRIYIIANPTANAVGVRQVQFSDNVRAAEVDGLRAWDVSFTLREVLSVPELAEQREPKASAVAQTSAATAVLTGQTAFERLLSRTTGVLTADEAAQTPDTFGK